MRDSNRIESSRNGGLVVDPKELYEVARNISPKEILQLVQDSKTDEERRFYAYIMNMNLQRGMKIAIENNLF